MLQSMGSQRGRHDLVTEQQHLENLACWRQRVTRPRNSGLWQYLFAESQCGHSYGNEDQGGRGHTQTHEEEGHVKTEAEIELQAKECWELLATTGSSETWSRFPRGPPGGTLPTPWFLASGILSVRECISVVLSHRVCGHLLQQPWTNAVGTKCRSRNCHLSQIHWGTSCFLSQWLWGSDDPSPWVLKESDTT